MSCCRNSYVEQGLSPMRMEVLVEDCGSCSYQSLLKDSIDALLKEAKDKFKGYDSCSTPENAELAYKKVRGQPIRVNWTLFPITCSSSLPSFTHFLACG